MDSILKRIANIIYINIQNTDNRLIKGKVGILLFYYHYSVYTGYKRYSQFADILLDEIYNDLNILEKDRISLGYPSLISQYAQIGWCINYLIEKKMVEGDSDEILADIDDKIEEYLVKIIDEPNSKHFVNDPDFNKSDYFYPGLYLLYRMKNNLNYKNKINLSFLIQKAITTILDSENKCSLSFLNSLYYLLSNLKADNILPALHSSIFLKIKKSLELSESKVQIGDIQKTKELLSSNQFYVDKKLISQINNIEIQEKVSTDIKIRDISYRFSQNLLYKQELLYLDLNKRVISSFLDSIVMDIDNEYLSIDGLAGIGLNLIKYLQNEKV